MNTTNKSICSYPWRAACIAPVGIVKPCCYWLSRNGNLTVENSNVSANPRNSHEWTTIKVDMLAGKPIKGCERCYEMEAVGMTSGRESSLHYMTPTDIASDKLEYIELAFSNLCNLACVGCSDLHSTKWSTENIKAGRSGMRLVDNKFDWSSWDLSQLKTLKILGGEPFMECDRFCDLLDKVNLSELELIVNTNGTHLPNERLRVLIEQCKQVKFIVSIDGVADANNWNRWPGKFDTVIDTMNLYRQWWGELDNIFLHTNTVVNIYNIFTMSDFIDYMKTDFSEWAMSFTWVTVPDWQAIRTLPEKAKIKLIEEFDTKTVGDLKTFSKNSEDFFKISIQYLNLPTDIKWESVVSQTRKLATERNLDVQAMLPDLSKLL